MERMREEGKIPVMKWVVDLGKHQNGLNISLIQACVVTQTPQTL
ncbi:L-type lectin-domain containing receptor kinase VII.1 [Bienertia sinuspersici]